MQMFNLNFNFLRNCWVNLYETLWISGVQYLVKEDFFFQIDRPKNLATGIFQKLELSTSA